MADQGGQRLDATAGREVVFCHLCQNEWFRDEGGLICPRCEGEASEIVSPENDPRPWAQSSPPPIPPEIQGLHDHNPWAGGGGDSDPEEADIEEEITRGPGGNVLIRRTYRVPSTIFGGPTGHGPRNHAPEDPEAMMRDMQGMIGGFMGPRWQGGPTGRSGQETLFATQGAPFAFTGGNGRVVGGRFTWTSANGGVLRPRDPDIPQPGPGPQATDIEQILGSLFGGMGPAGTRDQTQTGPMNGLPPAIAGLFASMFGGPANARSGDAVYTQEALDRIISNLMEQHPTSNAPGPASPDAISSLPKIHLSEKELGPEHKGECSVCMDDVAIGDEVVALPCTHWFHEACASAWLSEHNTCPICRKGIEGNSSSPSTSRRPSQTSPTSRNDHRARRLSRLGRENSGRYDTFAAQARHDATLSRNESRNEERLEQIRNLSRFSPPPTGPDRDATNPPSSSTGWGSSRWSTPPPVPHESRPHMNIEEDYAGPMPGSFHRRPSDMSENQRDPRRGNTSESDRSRRSSQQSDRSAGGGGGGGVGGWLRDRFGGGRREGHE